MRFEVRVDVSANLAEVLAERTGPGKHLLAAQVAKDTEPYVPMLTGSQVARTRVVGDTIIYPGPYANYLYRGKGMVDAATGKGPMRITDKFGNEFIRFHKGARLVPTNRPLKYTTDFHPLAGPAWCERSKAQNLRKWERIAQKVVDGHA